MNHTLLYSTLALLPRRRRFLFFSFNLKYDREYAQLANGIRVLDRTKRIAQHNKMLANQHVGFSTEFTGTLHILCYKLRQAEWLYRRDYP